MAEACATHSMSHGASRHARCTDTRPEEHVICKDIEDETTVPAGKVISEKGRSGML